MVVVFAARDEQHTVISSISSSSTRMRSPRRLKVLAHVIGPYGQLPVAAIDEDRELDPRGATELHERVDGSANGPTRVQDVVDEHDRHSLDRERNARRAHDRLAARWQLIDRADHRA
jgi:hypothetical protein